MKLFRSPIFAAFFPTLGPCAYFMSVIIGIAIPASLSAQTGGALPAAAQQAVDKGIIAAKLPDYLLAIRYLEDARKIAPNAPVIYLNLGVAESKIPSRELRAIGWFAAYLAVVPDAPNAPAVKDQITVLQVRNQSNVSRLIRTVEDTASHSKRERDSMLGDVSVMWTNVGDTAAAHSIADRLEGYKKDLALKRISYVEATRGDLVSARTTANLIEDVEQKAISLEEIGRAQINSKDVRGARITLLAAFQTASLIETAWSRWNTQNYIAQAQIDAGDILAAHQTLLDSLKANDLMPLSAEQQAARGDIYVLMQDAPRARSAFLSAYDTSKNIADPHARTMAQLELATSQGKAGDLANAAQTISAAETSANLADHDKAGLLELVEWKRVEFALAQLRARDFTGAKKTADLVGDANRKSTIEMAIRTAQTKTDAKPTPVHWLNAWLYALDSTSELNQAPFLDLAGYVRALPASDNPREVFDGLYHTAAKLVGSELAADRMLKQQGIQ